MWQTLHAEVKQIMGDPFDFNDRNPDGPEIGEAPEFEEVPENLDNGLYSICVGFKSVYVYT